MTKNLCKKPVYLKQLGHRVPCGHCRACRLRLRSEWSLRMVHELDSHRHLALFVTLTYDNDHLPSDGSLKVRDIQLFYKRLRKALGPVKIKHYTCGEYGPRTMRPHYHAIIFGLNMSHAQLVFDAWGKCKKPGFKCYQVLNRRMLGYVSGYTAKKLGSHFNQKWIKDHGLLPPYQQQSTGIGAEWCDANRHIMADGYLTNPIDPRDRVIPPRYYRKRLGLGAELYAPLIQEKEDAEIRQISAETSTNYVVSLAPHGIRSRYRHGHYVVTPAFFQALDQKRDCCDQMLKSREHEWRSKL